MIKVAICDDDIQFIYKLEQSIFRFAEMKRIKVDVDGYTSGAEFIQKLQQSERYDLLFLDIELGDSSGIIVGNWIRSQIQYESMQIVFVSAKEMYAMQLFDLRPMNFLVKPIQQERVDYILDEYERLYQFQPHIIEIGKGRNSIRIEEHSVFYLQTSIFTYGLQKGLDRLAAANVVNHSLSNFEAVCEAAAEEGKIKPEDIERLKRFRANPSDESWITSK